MVSIDRSSKVYRCPKCKTPFETPLDTHTECPNCGIWFHKWNNAVKEKTGKRADRVEELSIDEILKARELSENPLTFYGQLAILIFISLWGVLLIATGYRTDEFNASFMHAILLPIHEAGHVFFSPFGEFIHFLGGSLFQIALPLGIAIAFQTRQFDSFGAAICLWWTGTSVLDLAPYIWDAFDPVLPLVGGGEHDWVYLLSTFGALEHAHLIGTITHYIGALITVMGVLWASSFLYQTRKTARRFF